MDSMDFHSLSRRELQSLCKKNKIPANMTNIAMADALTALTNVIGIEEIGQSESAMPETPLTSRRTAVRKTAVKPQAVESESTQTLTKTRRATARKTNKEDHKDLSETTSVNETPAPRTGRKRVTGTSVCRKLDAQTQEVKEEIKEERPVVLHAYSTRRSCRLQSDQKNSESVQKRGGRKTEAVKIAALSEEETDDVQMKSNSDAIVEVQENQGDNVMVLDPIPDAAQEDLISEDGSSTVVSADVSSSIGEVSSANQDLISVSKDEFSVEQSSEQQDMSDEVSSSINDAHVSDISVSEITLISESKDQITFDGSNADQDMSIEDSNVASDDLHDMEIKEESAVEVTVVSPNVSSQKTAQIPEEKTHDLVKPNVECLMSSLSSDQVDDMNNEDEMVESNESHEVENADDSGLKFSFEDELCDIESEMFDFGNMKETVESEKLVGDEMQDDKNDDQPPVLNLKSAIVPSPSKEALEDNQFKSDVSISVEQLENQKVDSDKCDSIADEEDVKADSLLDDVSTDEEDSNNESDDNDESVDNDESDDDETVDNDESDDNDEIHESPVAALVKSQNPVTPLKSSSAKKTATPNSRMMIKVLEDTEENNKSGKITLKSNSKLLATGVAEEKENSDNNKGENTAQKSLKKKSLRQLKKMFIEMTISTKTKDNKNTMGKEDLQVEKRSALQMLNDNCLVG